MRNTAAFPKLSLYLPFFLLLLISTVRCCVAFTSPTRLAGCRGIDPRDDATQAFRTAESRRKEHSKVLFRSQPTAREGDPEGILSRRRENSWIVLVDDEEPIRTAVGQFFLDKGYRVTTCADGKAALEAALSSKNYDDGTGERTTTHEVPDCIVSDIRMPVMDGLALLGNIRNNEEHAVLSHVPVVLLTARANVQDRIAGWDAGADAYLTKPFSPEELVAIVDNVIERSEDLSIEHRELNKEVGIEDLRNDLAEIKNLLLHKGGGGVGNGWVKQTNVFLSKDERTVLDLLSRGLITKEIAAKTHLSTRRIEQLLTGMFRKAEVKNRTELVRWAVSTGNVE